MIIAIVLSLAAFFLLLKVEIPALRRRLVQPGPPVFIILEAGFIMGLGFIALSPLGHLALRVGAPAGAWQAAVMTGFSILALAGFASFYLVHIRRIRP